ncbi:MAG: serine/threonine protein kinase [Planctomycetes bacterium]|nr:serine/threonine protein kinase [Planctomycetota bacterium]
MAMKVPTAEEAVRRVASLPPSRRVAALQELLHQDRSALSKALEMLPTSGSAAVSMLSRDEAATEVRIGPYLLRSVLGEGGFGIVWLAEQDEPLRRSVALKILRPDRLDSASRARFETERRMVALLDHPGLVKVFDAGESADGRPWFAMELAAGSPVTQACDVAGISLGERIDLMALICRAVHHAHQRGVIHRDLKPSNILVSLDAGEPVVKVIDFGVARAVFDPVNPDERSGAFVGTPSFMAPEARDLRAVEADPRMDIYALGAVMLRLLADAAPDDSAPRPAHLMFARLPRQEARLAAKNRSASPAEIVSILRGDLDAIIARCLSRDPRGRYDSALALAQDLERFRRGESVQARPDSPLRRLDRLLRHNFVAVILTTVALAAIAASVVTAFSERARALAAKDRSEISARNAEDAFLFVTELLTEIVATPGAPPRTTQEILTEASRLVGIRLSNNPVMEARARVAVGRLWTSLKHDELATQEFTRAIDLLQSRGQPRLLAEAELLLAESYRATGRFADAHSITMTAEKQFEAEQPSDADDVARSLLELARIEIDEGRTAEAADLLMRAQNWLLQAQEPQEDLAKQIQSLADSIPKPPAAAPGR